MAPKSFLWPDDLTWVSSYSTVRPTTVLPLSSRSWNAVTYFSMSQDFLLQHHTSCLILSYSLQSYKNTTRYFLTSLPCRCSTLQYSCHASTHVLVLHSSTHIFLTRGLVYLFLLMCIICELSVEMCGVLRQPQDWCADVSTSIHLWCDVGIRDTYEQLTDQCVCNNMGGYKKATWWRKLY